MIYTIGHKATYLQAIANSPDGKIYKLGKRDDYEGGYAFQVFEDAQRRIDEAYPGKGFAVFGLLAEWAITEPSQGGWWHNLIRDAEIVVL